MLPHNISLEEMMSSQSKQVEWLKFLTDNGGALMGQKYVDNYFCLLIFKLLILIYYIILGLLSF